MTLLVFSCSLDSSFKDLTPDNGFESEFWFDAMNFNSAIEKVNSDPENAGEVFTVPRPDHLYFNNALGTLKDTSWVSTDTFAFQKSDYQRVLNKIVSTAESRPGIVNSRQEGLKWKNLSGSRAYSKPKTKNQEAYYLVPIRVLDEKVIWLKVVRKKEEGNPFGAYFYTAHGIWLEGVFEVLEKGGNIS